MSGALHRRLFERLNSLLRWLGVRGAWIGRASGVRVTIKLTGHKAGAWGAWAAGAKGASLVGLIAWRRGLDRDAGRELLRQSN